MLGSILSIATLVAWFLLGLVLGIHSGRNGKVAPLIKRLRDAEEELEKVKKVKSSRA